MELVQLRRRTGWVIIGLPFRDFRWCGPYATRREAEEDFRGLRRSLRDMVCELGQGVSEDMTNEQAAEEE